MGERQRCIPGWWDTGGLCPYGTKGKGKNFEIDFPTEWRTKMGMAVAISRGREESIQLEDGELEMLRLPIVRLAKGQNVENVTIYPEGKIIMAKLKKKRDRQGPENWQMRRVLKALGEEWSGEWEE